MVGGLYYRWEQGFFCLLEISNRGLREWKEVCTIGRWSVRMAGMYEWYDASMNGRRSVRMVADLCEWQEVWRNSKVSYLFPWKRQLSHDSHDAKTYT